jgi:hypothetical protein
LSRIHNFAAANVAATARAVQPPQLPLFTTQSKDLLTFCDPEMVGTDKFSLTLQQFPPLCFVFLASVRSNLRRYVHICSAVPFLLAIRSIAGPAGITNAVFLTPPANFHSDLFTHARTDPGDNPFSLDGPDLLTYVKYGRDGGGIYLQRGLVGAYVGQGKVVHFRRVNAALLKDELEDALKRVSGNSPAVLETIDGYAAAALTISRGPGGHPRFLHFCWIQIEGNEALKVEARSDDADTFTAMTNCLRTLTVDKRQYFNALNLRDAIVSTNQLTRIEIGHVMRGRAAFGCCVLHAEQKTYSFMP